jgi:hypothetical protein
MSWHHAIGQKFRNDIDRKRPAETVICGDND